VTKSASMLVAAGIGAFSLARFFKLVFYLCLLFLSAKLGQ